MNESIDNLLKALAEALGPHLPSQDWVDADAITEALERYDFTDIVENVITEGCVVGDQIEREIQNSDDIIIKENVEDMIRDAIGNIEVEITQRY
jgi:hypothetical protein